MTSVIIPTYNGARKVSNLLRYLERQELLPDEVIVVIDGSTDGTREFLDTMHFELPSLLIMEQQNGGRAKVRNRGVQEAKGDLLIFFDDDMRPLPACIREHVQHHKRFPGSILTGGLSEEVLNSSSDFLRFKACLSERWNEPLKEFSDMPMPEGTGFITAANCSMSRAVWDRLGGFDERLSDAEDYDLATRANLLQIPLFFGRKAFAWHDDIITCRSYIKRLREYRQGVGRLQETKPELYSGNHKFAIQQPAGLKKIFYGFFCNSFWLTTIDRQRWRFLPQFLRFRLYDWVITANGYFFPDKINL